MTALSLGRLLIVDDEIELRSALSQMLAEQGYETVEAGSGEEALALLTERDIDLMLTDLMMPEMDGIELLREGLGIDPHLVGILMTGQGTVSTAVNAMKAGAFDYILKPFKLQTLLPTLSRAMELRRLRLDNVLLRGTTAIYELSRTIAVSLDSETILRRIAEGAREQCGADEASVMLPADGDAELYVAAVRGDYPERILGRRVAMEGSISGWVAQHREPVTLHGEVNDPRFQSVSSRGGITSASVPMLAGGKLVGVLNVNATGRRRPFTPGQVKVLTILASTGATALEEITQRSRVEEELRASQSRQRRFVREVLFSVTEGRLRLCEGPDDLPAPLSRVGEPTALTTKTLKTVRRQVEQVAAAHGLPEQRWIDLVTGLGEAAMNAVVHGSGGEAWMCADPGGMVQVWIKDQGRGIGFDSLHRATLERGWTTAGSLGYGFWLMIKTCDRVWLLTGPAGTTVVLEQGSEAPLPTQFSG